MNIKLNKAQSLIEQKDDICNMLVKYGYTDVEELGSGAFGIVLKVKTKEGFNRALKIQLCDSNTEDIEVIYIKNILFNL